LLSFFQKQKNSPKTTLKDRRGERRGERNQSPCSSARRRHNPSIHPARVRTVTAAQNWSTERKGETRKPTAGEGDPRKEEEKRWGGKYEKDLKHGMREKRKRRKRNVSSAKTLFPKDGEENEKPGKGSSGKTQNSVFDQVGKGGGGELTI